MRRLALVQDHVVLGRRAGEDDAPRARLDGAQHEVRRKAHHARGEVDVGAEVGKHGQRGRPLELDPDALEKTQRLLHEGALLGLVEPGHVRTHLPPPISVLRPAAASRRHGHRAIRGVTAAREVAYGRAADGERRRRGAASRPRPAQTVGVSDSSFLV